LISAAFDGCSMELVSIFRDCSMVLAASHGYPLGSEMRVGGYSMESAVGLGDSSMESSVSLLDCLMELPTLSDGFSMSVALDGFSMDSVNVCCGCSSDLAALHCCHCIQLDLHVDRYLIQLVTAVDGCSVEVVIAGFQMVRLSDLCSVSLDGYFIGLAVALYGCPMNFVANCPMGSQMLTGISTMANGDCCMLGWSLPTFYCRGYQNRRQ